ncbi:MAG TPA: hypothetical protein VGE32_15300 [Cellvibrio sp.]
MDDLSKFDQKFFNGLIFCIEVYELFEKIRSAPDGESALRMRKSTLEKRLLEELLPLCKYIQSIYRAGRYVSICWVDGSQNYDAKMEQSGSYIDQEYYPKTSCVEVTSAIHRNDYYARKRLDTVGFICGYEGLGQSKNGDINSIPDVYKGREFIVSDSLMVLDAITKKVEKSYPEKTALVVRCSLSTIYGDEEWSMLIAEVKKGLPKCNFLEIFVYASLKHYSHTFCADREC